MLHCHVLRGIKARAAGCAVDAASGGRTGQCGHGPPRGGHHADGAVGRVSNINRAGTAYRHALRAPEPGRAASAVPAASRAGQSSQSSDGPGGRNLPDGVVEVIGHVKIASAVDGDAGRLIEKRVGSSAIRAAQRSGRAGQGRDHSAGSDHANGRIARVSHIHVAGSASTATPSGS